MSTLHLPIETSAEAITKPARASRTAWIGLAAGILLTLFFGFRVFAFVHDDAFITYRYAYNLRHGLGPVFNAGEHTEGYSCPLYMLLTAVGMFLPGDVLVRAKLMGLLFACSALWAVWRLAATLEMPAWACGAVPLILGASGSLAFSAVDGMETSFQMFLVTMAADAFVRERKTGRGRSSTGWLLAAALNRPEGPLFFVAALLPFALDIRQRGFGRREKIWLAAFALPLALFVLWRKAYYGDWLPNTYYAKNMPLEKVLDLSMGPTYLLRTLFVGLDQQELLLGLSVLLWLFALGGAASDRFRRHGALVVPLFVLAQTCFALRAGGDWMQGWRYMMAVLPLWMLLIVGGLAEAVEAAVKAGNRLAAASVAATGVVALAGLGVWAGLAFKDPAEGVKSWADQGWTWSARELMKGYRMENTVVTSDFLNRRLPPNSVVAYSEMGSTPFFSPGLRFLDSYGLTDRTIARLPTLARFRTGITGDYTDLSTDIGRHILARRPDFVLRWRTVSTAPSAILGGAYVPFAEAPLPYVPGREALKLQLWKRAQ